MSGPPTGLQACIGRVQGADGERLHPILVVEWEDGTTSQIAGVAMSDEIEAVAMAMTMMHHTIEMFAELGITLTRSEPT